MLLLLANQTWGRRGMERLNKCRNTVPISRFQLSFRAIASSNFPQINEGQSKQNLTQNASPFSPPNPEACFPIIFTLSQSTYITLLINLGLHYVLMFNTQNNLKGKLLSLPLEDASISPYLECSPCVIPVTCIK